MISICNLVWKIKEIFERGFQYPAFHKSLEERANLLARNVDVFGSRTGLIEIQELIRRYPTIGAKYGWLLDHYPERSSKLLH